MDGTAIILTNGILDRINAKTAHGLLRATDRYEIVAVIDPKFAGRDAADVLDGQCRSMPIFADIDACMAAFPDKPDYCVVGVATHGGRLPEELIAVLLVALQRGISIVNGLHDFACDVPVLAGAALAGGAQIIDVRRTPPRSELHFWHGNIYDVKAPRLAVLGTDCAIGKRTTTRFLVEGLCARGVQAQMIYTGQTGWMQGARYGFIFDSVPNDFVPGELENAVCECDRELKPDLIVIEGQSSLRNPSGPAGAELLASAQTRGVILQHAVGRTHFEGYEALPHAIIPSIEEEVQIISLYGARVVGVALNASATDSASLVRERDRLRECLGVTVAAPLVDGMDSLVEAAADYAQIESGRVGR